MDIKKWFEDGTGLKIKELRYLKMPPLPYNIYIDDQNYRGSDQLNNIIEHNVTIEHYSKDLKNSNELEIENFLNKNSIHFEKNREWLQDENMFVTLYELETYIEKRRKESGLNE